MFYFSHFTIEKTQTTKSKAAFSSVPLRLFKRIFTDMQWEEISLLLWKNTVTPHAPLANKTNNIDLIRERPLLYAYLTGTKSMGQKGGLIIVGLGTSARGLPWVASRQEQVHRLRRKVCLWHHRRPPRGVLITHEGERRHGGVGGDHCSYRRTTRDWSLR